MNPIYNEYINFLKDNDVNTDELNLKEGYYWLDRQIIKAYDKQGKIHKIARLNINDDLNITYKLYPKETFKIASWVDLLELNKNRIDQLEKESLQLISNSISKYSDYLPITLTSGGKDSSVTMHLVRKIKNNSLGVFNNTSLDCADTYLHIKELDNTMIINPEEGFYQWRKRNNFIPTRFARVCCSIFKEGAFAKVWDKNKKTLIFMGMRNEESNTRSDYGDYWRNENEWSDNWDGVLPIRKWTELDIWLYIFKENIKINKKYKKGYSRVGCCTACPYYNKSTWVLDKYWYPTLYNRWHKILDEDFINNNKDIILNCTQKEYHLNWNGGVVRDEPNNQVIEEFSNRYGYDKTTALTYFGCTCSQCKKEWYDKYAEDKTKIFKQKKIKDKETISMNMKFIGRNNKDGYLCKKHLMQYLGINKDEWDKYIDDFKSQGCKLF